MLTRGWLVIGGDIGGTSTRILVAGYDGTPLRRGSAGGGNPIAQPETAATTLGLALHAALEGVDVARVRAAVIGIAGGSALDQPRVGAAFKRVWSDTGLSCRPTYVSDLEVAFAAGTAEADGTVLIAGTGAVAASLRNRRLIRTADGHGWLLGDDGSGFWLGRQAVQATLRILDEGQSPGPLASSLLRELSGAESKKPDEWLPDLKNDPHDLRLRVINALYARPPVQLAELAPLVTSACEAGDPLATGIVDEAARLLAQTLGRIRVPDDLTPIVLAGSLMHETSPVGERLRALVRQRFAGPVRSAADGAGGAAWLALAAAYPAAASPEARNRLTAATL